MRTKTITVSDALTSFESYLKAQGKSELTITNYLSDVRQFETFYKETLAPKAIVSLKGSAELVKDYVAQLKADATIKTTTTNRKVVSVRQFFHFCSVDPVISHQMPNDPAANIYVGKIQGKGQHTVKWLKREDIQRILDALPNIPRTNKLNIARNRAIILTLVNCGLRVSELSDLIIGDVKFDEGVLEIRRGKNDKFRQVPCTKGTIEAIHNWLYLRGEAASELLRESEYLFTSERSSKLSDRGVQHMCHNLSKLTGIEFSPHTLRHTYCKNVANKTGRLEIVADLAGHANINTTRIYTAPSMEELKKVIDDVEFE